ncbi:hypothetical protein L596_022758 [Steinernema carpocapsae]|uniref:Signal recognition particle subunit SRP68 n=1 Tax=Steinernema carpocapsae TaxID=34508 RepID=A0A4U5MMP4_STECR|nr:hypothetical protein L596_022758 [Steinernema carpocapsae]
MTVEAMEVDAPEVQTPVEPLPPFGTVSILHIIKDAQQKHGLRHKDYDRYMGYCGRRIERVRTSLKFKHTLKGKRKNAKFTLRPVTVESITEERFFDVVLFEAERCWAYAMALKQEAENDAESRKKFHKIRKLRKAVKHATQLEALAKQCDRADAATKLESQAYTAWIKGSLAFESHKWSEAYNFFNTVITSTSAWPASRRSLKWWNCSRPSAKKSVPR